MPSFSEGADTTLSDTLPDQWNIYVSPEGHPYYYNHATGQSEWVIFNTPGNQIPGKYELFKEPIVSVTVTAPDAIIATTIGKTLVEKKIVASAQLFPKSMTMYRCQDIVKQSNDAVLVLKVFK
jgi:hypothetical protein